MKTSAASLLTVYTHCMAVSWPKQCDYFARATVLIFILLNEVKLYFWIRSSQHIIDHAALSESVLKDLATINFEWTALL